MLDAWWGDVERQPGVYSWDAYLAVAQAAADAGMRVRVDINFHGTDASPLPGWVLEQGRQTPDIFYTDRAGNRSPACLSLGVDAGARFRPRSVARALLEALLALRHPARALSLLRSIARSAPHRLLPHPACARLAAPALAGRTGLEVYGQLLASFRSHFAPLLGTTIVDCTVGLGPDGELRYPSHPAGTFPGVGEFQVRGAPPPPPPRPPLLPAAAPHAHRPPPGAAGRREQAAAAAAGR